MAERSQGAFGRHFDPNWREVLFVNWIHSQRIQTCHHNFLRIVTWNLCPSPLPSTNVNSHWNHESVQNKKQKQKK